MDINQRNNFVFSQKYRVWRHVVFWLFQVLFFALLYSGQLRGFKVELALFLMWLPVTILCTYPLMYWTLPKYLLKGKYLPFIVIIVMWVCAALLIGDLYFRHVHIPFQQKVLELKKIKRAGSANLLSSMTTAFVACIIVLFKHWVKKQQEWLQVHKEKVTAELQLLKAQVHPHFLFNTLNNVYSFSLTDSPKTPELILKLSSLLSYMLYDCKAEQVLLEKELEVMKDYVDLERERYGNKIEISWNVEGNIKDRCIVPLILLPFLENAFKHGTSEQLEKPWLSFNLQVKQSTLRCKIANSKNEFVPGSKHGIGIENVKKRLAFLYPENHELKIGDEGEFFIISLLLKLTDNDVDKASPSTALKLADEKAAV